MCSSKVCFKCGELKSINEFYTHPKMSDGHLGKCKSCSKKDATNYRLSNIDRIRAYDRERAKNPDRAKIAAEISAAWRKKDKRIGAAHNAVTRAVRKGDINRMPCVRCGEKKSIAHHEDYNKKLEVTWFCQPCHKQRHKEMVLAGIDPILGM